MLEENLKAFREKLPELLEANEGKWAVGKAGDRFSCWDTYADAVQQGYKKYGLNPFLAKRITRMETPVNICYVAV